MTLIEEGIDEGVFVSREEFEALLAALRSAMGDAFEKKFTVGVSVVSQLTELLERRELAWHEGLLDRSGVSPRIKRDPGGKIIGLHGEKPWREDR